MTCGNRSREKKVKGYTLKKGELDRIVYVHDYEQMVKDMKRKMRENEKQEDTKNV